MVLDDDLGPAIFGPAISELERDRVVLPRLESPRRWGHRQPV